MSTTFPTPRRKFFCHECHRETFAADIEHPTCEHCRSDFVEEILEGSEDSAESDPRNFDPESNNNMTPGPNAFPLGFLSQLLSLPTSNGSTSPQNVTQPRPYIYTYEAGSEGGRWAAVSATDGDDSSSRPPASLEHLASFIGQAFSQPQGRTTAYETYAAEHGQPPNRETRSAMDDPDHTSNNPYNEGGSSSDEEARPNAVPAGLPPALQALFSRAGVSVEVEDGSNSAPPVAGFFSERLGNWGSMLDVLLGDRIGDYVGERSMQAVLQRLMEESEDKKGVQGLNEDDMKLLDRRKVSKEWLASHDDDDCPICQDAYQLQPEEPEVYPDPDDVIPDPESSESSADNSKIVTLPCHHVFHETCITHWLKLHGTCPICRLVITNKNGILKAMQLAEYEAELAAATENQSTPTASNRTRFVYDRDPAAGFGAPQTDLDLD